MYKVTIRGLEDMRKVFDADTNLRDRFLPEFGYLIASFHHSLEQEVASQYNTNRRLTSVLVGGLTPRSMSKRLVTGSLEYWEKPLPLAEFVTRTEDFLPSGWFVPTKGDFAFGNKLQRKKTPNQRQYVTVRKGKEKLVKGKAQQGAFKVGKKKVYLASRAQEETWIEEPSENNPAGKRDKVDLLFTIGLAKMAENVFTDFEKTGSGKLANDFEKLHDRLADAFIAAWRG